jgi:nucleoid-associated protein YgaU
MMEVVTQRPHDTPPFSSPLSPQVTMLMMSLLAVEDLAIRVNAMLFAVTFPEDARDAAVRIATVELALSAIIINPALHITFYAAREMVNELNEGKTEAFGMVELDRFRTTKTKVDPAVPVLEVLVEVSAHGSGQRDISDG